MSNLSTSFTTTPSMSTNVIQNSILHEVSTPFNKEIKQEVTQSAFDYFKSFFTVRLLRDSLIITIILSTSLALYKIWNTDSKDKNTEELNEQNEESEQELNELATNSILTDQQTDGNSLLRTDKKSI